MSLDWLTLAQDALRRYDIPSPQVTWLTQGHNAIFSVTTAQARYVLRLYPPGRGRAEWLHAEATWLNYLHEQGFTVPRPIRNADADAVTTLTHEAQAVRAMLFTHVAGASIALDALTVDHLHQIAHLLARLHHTAENFQPSPHFKRPRLDAEGLLGERSLYVTRDADAAYPADMRATWDAVYQRVAEAMADIGETRATFGLIHADLLLKNLLFHEQEARPLDFEFCGWGYYLYDLAPLLWQMKTLGEAYGPLAASLLNAYGAERPLPGREHLATFIAARQLASIRWLRANLDHPQIGPQAPELIHERTRELARYLARGRLDRGTPTL